MPPLSTKSQRQSKLAMSTMVPRPVHSPDSGSEHGPEMENPLIRVRLAKIIPYGSGQKANTTHPTRISHIDFFFFFGSFGFQPERQETGEASSILYTERQKTRKKSCKGSNDHTRPDQTTAQLHHCTRIPTHRQQWFEGKQKVPSGIHKKLKTASGGSHQLLVCPGYFFRSGEWRLSFFCGEAHGRIRRVFTRPWNPD